MIAETSIVERWENSLKHLRCVDRDIYLTDQCVGRSVLHLGCTDSPLTKEKLRDGSLLHQKIERACASVTGVDIDAAAIAALQATCSDRSRFVQFDVEDANLGKQLASDFDVVLCADIIEHLDNPVRMLRNVVSLMRPTSTLVISTINAYAMKLFIRALVKREAVHPDHVSYFSYATLRHLLGRHGLEIDEAVTFTYPFKSNILSIIQKPFYHLFPATADGIIVRCRLAS